MLALGAILGLPQPDVPGTLYIHVSSRKRKLGTVKA